MGMSDNTMKWKNVVKGVPCVLVTYMGLSFLINIPDDREPVYGRSMMVPDQELYFDIRPNQTDAGHTHMPGSIPLRHPHLIFKSPSNQRATSHAQSPQSTSKPSGVISQEPHYFNPHLFSYVLNSPRLCGAGPVFLMTFIHSAADHHAERMLIRKTWASIEQYGQHRIRTIFLVGSTLNPSDQWKLEEESRNYDDVVQETFVDSYRNLTHKHIMGLRWIDSFCSQAKYILKVDDDTFVNIFRVVDFLLDTYSQKPMVNMFYCSVFRSHLAIRNPRDKWFVMYEEYPHKQYPPWCEGFAYIMSPDLVHKLYSASLWTKYFWIDDVYVTGILAAQVGASHQNFRSPNGYSLMRSTHYTNNTINAVLFLLVKYQRIPTNTWTRTWVATKKYSSKKTITIRSYV